MKHIYPRYFAFPSFFRTTGDGNCLYNACSLALRGDYSLSAKLHALTSAELFIESDFYANHPLLIPTHKSNKPGPSSIIHFMATISVDAASLFQNSINNRKECVIKEALLNSQDKTWSSFLCMIALAQVIRQPIVSHYPIIRSQFYIDFLNRCLFPRDALVVDPNINKINCFGLGLV